MLKNHMAYFKVETFNGIDGATECGFYPANTFGEAADYLEEFYGGELVVISHLELMNATMITMDETVAKEILKNY